VDQRNFTSQSSYLMRHGWRGKIKLVAFHLKQRDAAGALKIVFRRRKRGAGRHGT